MGTTNIEHLSTIFILTLRLLCVCVAMAAQRPKKTARKDDEAEVVIEDTGDGPDMESLLAEWGAKISSVISQQVQGETGVLLRKYDSQIQRQFRDVEGSLKDVQERQAAVESKQKDMASELARLSKALAVAESTVDAPLPPVDDEFTRDPDPTILRINSHLLVAKSAILDGIPSWLDGMDLPDTTWTLHGSDKGLSKSYTLAFTGERKLAARRATKALR